MTIVQNFFECQSFDCRVHSVCHDGPKHFIIFIYNGMMPVIATNLIAR